MRSGQWSDLAKMPVPKDPFTTFHSSGSSILPNEDPLLDPRTYNHPGSCLSHTLDKNLYSLGCTTTVWAMLAISVPSRSRQHRSPPHQRPTGTTDLPSARGCGSLHKRFLRCIQA